MSEKLVLLRTVPDRVTAEMEKSFLQESGVKAMIKADSQASGVFMGVFGGFSPMSPWLIYVMETDVEKARGLIGEEVQDESPPIIERRKRGTWYMISLIAMIIALLIILL